jgi:hypothetical protein
MSRKILMIYKKQKCFYCDPKDWQELVKVAKLMSKEKHEAWTASALVRLSIKEFLERRNSK